MRVETGAGRLASETLARGSERPRLVVIGGGIAGLGAARRLASLLPDASITLVEKQPRLGGKILTERFEGFVIEAGPEALFAARPRGVELCIELGLEQRLVSPRRTTTGTAILARGRLRTLPDGLGGMIPTRLGPLARSDLFSLVGKLRMALEMIIPPNRGDHDESIASFVERRLGREAYQRLVEPLVGGIYAGDPSELSLEATLPHLRRIEREQGGIVRGTLAGRKATSESARRGPPFLAPRSGLAEITDALERELHEADVKIRLGTEVVTISREPGGGYAIGLAGGDTLQADALVCAAPAPASALLVAGLDDQLSEALRGIPHASVATIALAYRQLDVSGTGGRSGYLTPRSEGRPVRACTIVSEKWADRVPDDMVLFRLSIGGAGQDDTLDPEDSSLERIARTELADLFGITAPPVLARVFRWPEAMPQYVLGHRERVASIERRLAERWPGFALAGNAFHGVGLSDSFESGERAAERIAMTLAEARARA